MVKLLGFTLKYVRVRGTSGVVTSSSSQDGVKETTPSCATTCDTYINARLIALSKMFVKYLYKPKKTSEREYKSIFQIIKRLGVVSKYLNKEQIFKPNEEWLKRTTKTTETGYIICRNLFLISGFYGGAYPKFGIDQNEVHYCWCMFVTPV